MWPWEHVAVGYIGYWVFRRLRRARPPCGPAAWALVFGALFPDLVDKPLAWSLGLLSSGVSAAHSVFVAVPLSVGVWLAARRAGRGGVGAAFGAGYLLHLPADLLYPLALGGGFSPSVLLWPLVTPPSPATTGLFRNVQYYLGVFLAHVSTSRGLAYLAFEAALLAGALALWVADGRPGLPGGDRRGDP